MADVATSAVSTWKAAASWPRAARGWKVAMISRDSLRHAMLMGGDGFVMLIVSTLLIVLSLGLSFVWAFIRVLTVALRLPFENGSRTTVVAVAGHALDASGVITATFVRRLDRALTLCPSDGWIIVMGGVLRPGQPSEAARARDYLTSC